MARSDRGKVRSSTPYDECNENRGLVSVWGEKRRVWRDLILIVYCVLSSEDEITTISSK